MKKLKQILLLILLFNFILLTNSFADTGVVNIQALRIRKEPSTTSTVVTNVYEDDVVEILEVQDEWYKVKYGSYEGYAKKEFLTIKTENVVNNSNTVTENNIPNNEVQNVPNNNPVIENNTKVMTNSNTNVRLVPNLIFDASFTLEGGKELTKLDEINNWIKITDGNITGWIPKAKVQNSAPVVSPPEDSVPNPESDNQVENTVPDTNNQSEASSNQVSLNKKGIVNVETANVREKADSKATIIGFLDYNDIITIEAEEGDWYKISSPKASGYVSKRLITLKNETVSSRGNSEDRRDTVQDDVTLVSEETNPIEELGKVEEAPIPENPIPTGNSEAVVEFAKQYLGYPYVSGGKNPTSGFDCSGFTKYVFGNFGFTLGATAASQTSVGTEVARENLRVGDLILFYDEGMKAIGHTGIYMGDGNFIHAANPKRGVVTDNINTNSYYNIRFITARRIVE